MKNKQLSTNKQIAINLSASFVTYLVTLSISFFLSPYIIRTVGVDAYGFVGLANNFISYVSLITIALNALSGRFITVYIYKDELETANKYYTSVFYANLFLGLIMFIIELFLWIFLNKIINIPENLNFDVKLLFASMFLNSVVGTVTSVFSISVFATNKLYLGSIRTIESSIARAVILVIAYIFLAPRVYYLGVTSFIVTLYCAIYNFYYVKKLTPYLRLNRKLFDFKVVKELVFSGVWNLVTRLGQILSDGLDLLITNLFIDSVSMGVLSVAKTVPGVIGGIVTSMVGTFSPNFTILYAENKINELKIQLKRSMKIMGIICNIPIIVLMVCGEKFYALWQPTQDAKELQILSILTCAGLMFSGGINCIYNIFTVVNKLKFNSIAVVTGGLLSTLIVFVLVKTTSLGVYAVAGVSTVINVIRNLAFTAPYGAKCLKLKWYTFYPDIFRPVLFVIISIIPCLYISRFFTENSWFTLIILGLIVLAISFCIGFYIILNKEERTYIYGIVQNKLLKRRRKAVEED